MAGKVSRRHRWVQYVVGSILWAAFVTVAFGYVLGGILASQLVLLHRPIAAIAMYRAALSIYPWNAPNRNDLGLTLLEYGNVDEAIAELRRALELAPSVPKYHNHLGVALLKSGRVAEAIDQFEEAIRLNPQWEEPKRNLKKTLSQREKLSFRDRVSGPG